MRNCQQCRNCKRDNCGKCANCKDMISFGGRGIRKARCQQRVCVRNSPKGSHALPTKSKTESKVVVKPSQSLSKQNKSEKVSKTGEANIADSGAKSANKALNFVGNPHISTRTEADSSVKEQASPKVQASTKSKPVEDIVKTPQDSGEKAPESKPTRNSPRLKPAVQSAVVPVTTNPAPDEITDKQETAAPSKNSENISNSTPSKVENVVSMPSGTSVAENAGTTSTKKEFDLPTVKLDSMSKAELKEFIPKLLKLVTGKEEVFYSRRSAKPEWWPEDVPWAASKTAWFSEKYWTNNLRSVVKNCYKHVGREDLLQNLVNDSSLDSRYSTHLGEDGQNENTVKTGSYQSSPVKIKMFPQDLFLPFSAEIYICYFCEKEFLSKEKMRSHQNECTERPPDLQHMFAKVSESNSAPTLQIPNMSTKNYIDKNWPKLSLDKFSGYLDLVPKHTAAKLREQRRSIEEVSCEILDELEPVSPVTPKTPRSLISQLSREDPNHGSRKRLSYSFSMDGHKDTVIEETEPDSDGAETEQSNRTVHENNFLDIPISSLLGQRIKNYVHVDTPMSVVEDTGTFCRTPVKNTFLEKLRKKPLAYPILYRPRRIANMHKQNHIYKFKKSEVKQFMNKINTGLSMSSIEKLKSMKKFTIRVPRLSRKKLLNWIPRQKLDKQLRGAFRGLKYNPFSDLDNVDCEFPAGPTLLAKNIDKLLGLKKRSSQDSLKMSVKNSLSLSNFISEEMEAEVSKQKLTLYRSLLYEMSVLKPAVVMEDIGQVKGENDAQKQCESKVSAEVDNVKEKKVRTSSVFRDMIRKSKEERIMAEVVERERKEDYQTLKSLLMAPKTPENIRYISKNTQGKTKSVSADVYGVKKDARSPNDDSVSIMSASSEGESLHSNCCQGCCDKKHHQSKQTSAIVTSSCPITTPPLIQPLHVDVDLNTMKIDEYGIPSPMSISSESPFPPTPSKSNSSLLDNLSQVSVKGIDSVESSPINKRETRSTRSSGFFSLFNEGGSVFAPKSPKSHEKNLCSVSDSVLKSSLRQVQSEGMQTRSCSNTPNDSPVKRLTRSGSSAPVSPSKVMKQLKAPLDVKQVSRNLEGPAFFQGTNVDTKFKLRSGMSVSDVSKCDSPQCSNLSPQSDTAAVCSKQSSGSGSVLKDTSLKDNAGVSSVVDNPLRRSKRRSSFLSAGVQPTKLRKVYSDMAVNTR